MSRTGPDFPRRRSFLRVVERSIHVFMLVFCTGVIAIGAFISTINVPPHGWAEGLVFIAIGIVGLYLETRSVRT